MALVDKEEVLRVDITPRLSDRDLVASSNHNAVTLLEELIILSLLVSLHKV